jgi:hypothetical protein
MHFRLTNPDPDQGGVGRMVQHPTSAFLLWWILIGDLRLCMSMARYGLSLLTKRVDQTHIAGPTTAQAQLRKYTNPPGFRSGLSHNNRIISCPPYFITDDKASADFQRKAPQYLALIAAFLLQERLLLRHLIA